jgi:hypothetical protein
VTENEIQSAGFGEDIFRNVNTPEEYEWVKSHLIAAGTAEAKG